MASNQAEGQDFQNLNSLPLRKYLSSGLLFMGFLFAVKENLRRLLPWFEPGGNFVGQSSPRTTKFRAAEQDSKQCSCRSNTEEIARDIKGGVQSNE